MFAPMPIPARADATSAPVLAMALLVVAAVALAWSNAWPGAFQFDDYAVIVDEPRVHGFAAWWYALPGLRPLLKASYVLSWKLGGGDPVAFLAVNVALHAANALLVLALARRLLPWIAPDIAVDTPRANVAALAAALVFALHPAQTESVTYLSGRSGSLMALCWLSALLCWLRGAPAARAGALALFVAAMAVKETALSWPCVVLVIEVLRRGSFRAAARATLAPFAIAVACVAVMAGVPIYTRLAAASLGTRGPLANLAAQVDGIAYLVGGPLLTLRTNIDPQIDVTAFTPLWWARAVVCVAALAFAFASLRRDRRGSVRRPLAGLAIAWFALVIAPTNSLVARFDLANDRQLYLALVGPALAIGVVAARWRASVALVAILASVLATATLLRNRDYATEIALWQATARASPARSRVFNNLGYALQQAGRADEAASAYRRALALDPHDYKARANLDWLRLQRGSTPGR